MAPSLLPLAGLAAALAVAGLLLHRLRLPPAIGYLVVGLAGAPLIRSTGIEPGVVQDAASVGTLFLLFAIGLELDIRRLGDALRRTALALPVDILVPALLVAGAARLAGWSVLQAVTLGLCLSVSSTLFGDRLSSTQGFTTEARRRVLGMLLSEDVAAGALLAILAVLGPSAAGAPPGPTWLHLSLPPGLTPVLTVGMLLLFLLLAAAAALLVVPRLLDAVARTHAHDLLVLTGLALVIGFGGLGALAGSAPLGALVAGVTAAEAGARFVVRNALQTLRDVALAAFFFASGLNVDAGQALGHPVLVLELGALFLLAKLLVHVPTSLASGLGVEGSLRAALALGTVGEFSLILVAAAEASGLAHPLLADAVVGTMLLLLIVTPLLLLVVPRAVRLLRHLPLRMRRPVQWLVQGSRQARGAKPDAGRIRAAVRLLVVNLLLLLAWVIIAAAAGPWILAHTPSPVHRELVPTLLVGSAVAVAVPLLVGTFRAYRALAWLLVGGGPPDAARHDRGAQVRVRLVDLWLAVSLTLLIIPLGLLVPAIWPVLLGGAFLAVIIVALAWRRLAAFHRTMEASLSRVLGEDPGAGALLDRLLERYPWGLRVAAVSVPPGSPLAGARLRDARVPELTGATVAVLQRRGVEVVNPAPLELVHPGDTLVLLGDMHQIARAEALVVAHGEAIRLTAQSRLAGVAEVELHAGSDLIGTQLSSEEIRQRTGTMVVGVWPLGAQHPDPYGGGHVLREGDKLILLGAPLQVERARLLCEGVEVETEVDSEDEGAGEPATGP